MFRSVALALFVLAWASAAGAADLPRYAPPAAWVLDAPIPAAPPAEGAPEGQLLLHDDQFRADGAGDHWYHRVVGKIRGPGALAGAGIRQTQWNPAHDTLVIHHVRIIRDGQTIDALADGKGFLVIRRETDLARAMLNGELTAVKQMEGLRVGDLVDYAFTIDSRDPIRKGLSQWSAALNQQGVAGRVRLRVVWTDNKPIRWRVTEGLGEPMVTHRNGETEVLFDQINVSAPRPPADAPRRFAELGSLQLTQFADWAQVSALMAPLYSQAEVLDAASPIKAEAAKIRAATGDPKVQAGMALALVEDQTRYLALSMNDGGFVPARADETWTRRFGDCKGKTVLLLALLHQLGIEAQPDLVNTQAGDGMDARLPALLFDHVIVRAHIDGRFYWLDGTRVGDHHGIGSMDKPPNYAWALPIQPTAATLEPMATPPFATPALSTLIAIDASHGIDTPAEVRVDMTYTGDAALAQQREHLSRSAVDDERRWKAWWTQGYPWMAIDETRLSFDETQGEFHVLFKGKGVMTWRRNRDVGAREYRMSDVSLGQINLRQAGPNQDAPYVVAHPYYEKTLQQITLPDGGEGFSVVGDDVSATISGFEIVRRSRIENGVAYVEVSGRSLVPELPAAEVEAANRRARELTEDPMTLRAPKPKA